MRKRTGNIQQRGELSFRIRYTNADGIRQHETITGSRDDAERELAGRLGDIAKGMQVSSKPNTVLFGELADDVLTDYEINCYSSYSDAETRCRLHLVPTFGHKKAAQITTAQIKLYIVHRQQAGAKVGTVNRELELMRHAFNLAIEGRKLMHAPHVPRLREDNVRSGFFTQQEVERLTRYLPTVIGTMVWFAFMTGWRLGEIRKLLWRNVDFDRGEIRLDVGTTKNREGRVFPMSSELRALLKAHRTHQRRAVHTPQMADLRMPTPAALYVFTIDGLPVGEFRKSWKTACFKAGLPCVIDKNGKRPIKALRTFHDLRRSFAREMDTLGVRHGAIMKLGGWKTDSVFRRYNIVSEGDLRDAIDKINDAKHGHSGGRKGARKSR